MLDCVAFHDNCSRMIGHQTYYCFAPKTHRELLRNNRFFVRCLLRAPITHICRLSSHPHSLVFGSFFNDQNSKKELKTYFLIERVYSFRMTAFWQMAIKTKLRCSRGAWRFGYRACRKQAAAEHRSSYFQTGPDVMTEPNLNTGKSVQICQKRGSSSCKERPPMNRGVGFGNERELKSKIWDQKSIFQAPASSLFKLLLF